MDHHDRKPFGDRLIASISDGLDSLKSGQKLPTKKVRPPDRWYTASVRVFGDAIPFDGLNALAPDRETFSGRKGEHYQNSPKRGIREVDLWTMRSRLDSFIPTETQLEDLLPVLEEAGDRWNAILAHEGVEAELFLGYSSESGQGGFELSSAMLARIARLRLSVTLDLYPPSKDHASKE